jgi:Flp pilus assembly protein TadG
MTIQIARSRGISPGEVGAALTELAIVLPLLTILLTGTFKTGVGFYQELVATDIVRTIARTAAEKESTEEICDAALTTFQQALASAGLHQDDFELTVSTSSGSSGGLGWTSIYLHITVQLSDEKMNQSRLHLFQPKARATFPLLPVAGTYGQFFEISDGCSDAWNR